MYTCTKCKNINIYIHITYYTNVNECIIISSIIPEYCCCDTHSHLSPPCVSLLPVWLISDITYQYPSLPAQPTLSHLTALILQHNDTDTDQAYSVTHSHHQASSVTLCSESPLFCSCYCHSTLHITALFKIF